VIPIFYSYRIDVELSAADLSVPARLMRSHPGGRYSSVCCIAPIALGGIGRFVVVAVRIARFAAPVPGHRGRCAPLTAALHRSTVPTRPTSVAGTVWTAAAACTPAARRWDRERRRQGAASATTKLARRVVRCRGSFVRSEQVGAGLGANSEGDVAKKTRHFHQNVKTYRRRGRIRRSIWSSLRQRKFSRM
jgi:hypothetical protein